MTAARSVPRPHLPRTLTARLVAVVVVLVALSALVIATATTLAMQRNLERRLDGDVRDAARFATGPGRPGPDGDGYGDGPGDRFGTLRAYFPSVGAGSGTAPTEQEGESWMAATPLDDAQLAALEGTISDCYTGEDREEILALVRRLPEMEEDELIAAADRIAVASNVQVSGYFQQKIAESPGLKSVYDLILKEAPGHQP